jgi:outer membrane protein assembly factor BamB
MRTVHYQTRAFGLTILLANCALVVSAFVVPEEPQLPDFDQRYDNPGRALVLGAERDAALAELSEQLPNIQVDFDEIVQAPRWIWSTEGFLTWPDSQFDLIPEGALDGLENDPHRAIKRFLNEHRALFGHDASVLENAWIYQDYVTPHNGMRTTVWQQHVDGIRVFGGSLVGHVTRNGELINVSSGFLPDAPRAAGARLPNGVPAQVAAAISAQEALVRAAVNLGEELAPERLSALANNVDGPWRRERFDSAQLAGEAGAELIWLPMSRQALRLCWEVTLTGRSRPQRYVVLIDAQTGDAVARWCITYALTNASYNVFNSDSPSPFSPGLSQPSSYQPPLTNRVLVTWPALSTVASPNGWINDGDNRTIGNNIDAHCDWYHTDYAYGADVYRPVGPNRVFDFPINLTNAPNTYSNAAVVNLFYWCNWMHDKLYDLGFDEAAGNYQQDNFGRGGVGGDAVVAEAQDGWLRASPYPLFNNAQFTPDFTTDGTHGRLEMFLWCGPQYASVPEPWRDGDLDAEIICHEYTHGMTIRLVSKGGMMWGKQTFGLNEGWSDFVSLALLGQPSDDVRASYAPGGYVYYKRTNDFTANYYFGGRRYPYSTDLGKNPLTFMDISTNANPHTGVPMSPLVGYTIFSGRTNAPDAHNAGEVWCVMLCEARANLIDRYRAELGDPAQGYEEGNRTMLQLVVDGEKLAPQFPNFPQARDAILQADLVNNRGKHLTDLWTAFAKRGMGYGASSPTDVNNTNNWPLVESYIVPPQGTKKWEFIAGDGIYSSPALARDGQATATVYVGSADGKLYAINATNGVKRWEFTGDLGGWTFNSSPAVGTDGSVYVGGYDWRVYALNSNGVKKWSYYANGTVFSSPAIGDDGTIYVGVCNPPASVLALDPANGAVKWSFATGNNVYSSPAVASDGTVYAGSLDNKLYAIKNGVKQWDFLTGGSVYSSPAIGSDGAIYVGSYDGKVYCLNANGTKRWEFNTGDIVRSSPALGPDGAIYVGSQNGRLYCLNNDGTQRWPYTTGWYVWSSPALGADGAVYVGSYDGYLYAVTNGVMKWRYYGAGFSSPVIGTDGTVYIGSNGGKLTAISNLTSLASSPWPMFRQCKVHRGSWPNSATYLGWDVSTQGDWRGVYHDHYIYGSEGFHLMGAEDFPVDPAMNYPAYAIVEPVNTRQRVWATGISDIRALRNGSAQWSRIAACSYPLSGDTFSLDIDMRDGQPHKLALYLLDWDYGGRAESINISDADFGYAMSSASISSFYNGVYLIWRLKGHVRLDVTRVSGLDSVASGVFFDPY